MFLRKLSGLLPLLFIVGLISAPGDAWCMKRERPSEEPREFSLSEIVIPEEMYLKIFSYFYPFELTHGVCKHWDNLFSQLNLWTPPFLTQDSELYKQGHKAVEDLFKAAPEVAKLFGHNQYPNVLETLKAPTPLGYKNFYIATYLENSLKRLHSLPYKDEPRINKLGIMKETCVQNAKAEGYPLIRYDVAGNPPTLIWPGLCPLNPFGQLFLNLEVLRTALYGSSKSQHYFMREITDALENPDEAQCKALINLGQAWPEIRSELILRAYHVQGGRLNFLHNHSLVLIGRGDLAPGFFGHTVTLKWPEAQRLLGIDSLACAMTEDALQHYKRPTFIQIAKEYYETAYQQGDKKALKLIANMLDPKAENKSKLEELLKIYPYSGDILGKLGVILVNEIPANADLDDPNITHFIDFCKDAYQHLVEKQRGLVGIIHRGAQDGACHYSQKIKKPEDFMNFFGHYIRPHLHNYPHINYTGMRFLDFVMATPCYAYGNSWVAETMSHYFAVKWKDFLKNEKPPEKPDKWDPRETIYGFEYFSNQNSPYCVVGKRKFYELIMKMALNKKEDQNVVLTDKDDKDKLFLKAFKYFCRAVDKDNVGKGNYEFLEAKKKAFVKAFPQNHSQHQELDALFNTLRVSEPKPKKGALGSSGKRQEDER